MRTYGSIGGFVFRTGIFNKLRQREGVHQKQVREFLHLSCVILGKFFVFMIRSIAVIADEVSQFFQFFCDLLLVGQPFNAFIKFLSF